MSGQNKYKTSDATDGNRDEGERGVEWKAASENAVRLISRTAEDVNRGLGMENPKNRAKAPVWQA